jgi:putative transposase
VDAGAAMALCLWMTIKWVAAVCKLPGITDATYFRWRKEYGGMKVDQAKRLKALKQENARLKRLLADAELGKAILREAAHA